ncbi:RNA polymerase sigma factor [Planctomycetota bacterium]
MTAQSAGDINLDRKQQFETLYNSHARELYTYVNSFLLNRASAEDVMQSLFVKIFSTPGAPEKSLQKPSYLFAAARNLCLDFLRETRRGVSLRESFTLVESITPAQNLEQEELERQLSSLLAHLPDEQREVIMLKVYGDHTFASIAEITTAALATVHKRYQLGIRKLKAEWKY